jgi:hypothetical protein
MKTIVDPRLRRVGTMGHGLQGAFAIISPVDPERFLRIISSGPASMPSFLKRASLDRGWEHVSISLVDRCPLWDEMAFVKDLFWREDELVVQFHPPKAEYINQHSFCLHLWKSPNRIKLPPRDFV